MSIFVWDEVSGPGELTSDQICTSLSVMNGGQRCHNCGHVLKQGQRAMYWQFSGRDTWLLLHAECAASLARGMIRDLSACLPFIDRPEHLK